MKILNKKKSKRALLLSILDNIGIISEIAKYFNSIYDLVSFFHLNKIIHNYFNILFFPLLQSLIQFNLKVIINDNLSILFDDFENLLMKKLGLILSGSAMLNAICGENWAYHNSNFIKQNQILTKQKINKSIYKKHKCKKLFDLNLFVNTSLIQQNNYKLSEILQILNIEYDYEFPRDDKVVNFVKTYKKYLRSIHLLNIQNKKDENFYYLLNKEYLKIIDEYMTDINPNKMKLVKNFFDFIFKWLKELEEFNELFYKQFNGIRLLPYFIREKNGHLVLKLYKYNKIGNKCFLNISMDMNWKSKINKMDFEFLKLYWNPLDNLKPVYFNNSLYSILCKNYNNYNKIYIHNSAFWDESNIMKLNFNNPIILSFKSNNINIYFEVCAYYIWQSYCRKLKYFLRGFYCLPNVSKKDIFHLRRLCNIIINDKLIDYNNYNNMQSNQYLKDCFNYFETSNKKEIREKLFLNNEIFKNKKKYQINF